MALDDIMNGIPQMLSILVFFASVLLLFWGMRYFAATGLGDIGQFLAFTVPSIWLLGFSIYLWIIGKEDK
jgi:hypothetical protein